MCNEKKIKANNSDNRCLKKKKGENEEKKRENEENAQSNE
jgi:hypothetical protein